MFQELFNKLLPTNFSKLKGGHSLIVHFSYHKCMTSYFNTVFSKISQQFQWHHLHHNGILDSFYKDVEAHKDQISIISVNNQPVNFERLPKKYLGTHLIRDPRDLLISGYRYHLWCKEPWTQIPMSAQLKGTLCVEDLGLMDKSVDRSFQELLNTVDKEHGLLLELNFRKSHFQQMLQWNYSNPNILELRYEDLFGNEIEVFKNIFRHYGFSHSFIKKALGIVEAHSFKNLNMKGGTGAKKHASKGIPGQWKEELPASIIKIFKSEHGGLLEKVGYEKNKNW